MSSRPRSAATPAPRAEPAGGPRVHLRIDFDGQRVLGPGKIALLEHIRDTGSISAAARMMSMSYRRAWLLTESLNALFTEPAVATNVGGRQGGGARLTEFGEQLIADYRAMEAALAAGEADRLAALARCLRAPASDPTSDTAARGRD